MATDRADCTGGTPKDWIGGGSATSPEVGVRLT